MLSEDIRSESKTQYVLLTGHRKSGTTMLSRLFDSYPSSKVAVYPVDFTLLYAAFDVNKLSPDLDGLKTLIRKSLSQSVAKFDGVVLGQGQRPFNYIQFHNEVIESINEELMYGNRAKFCEYIADIYLRTVGLQNPTHFILKETSQTVHWPEFVKNHWKIVHLVRDPRDLFSAIKEGIQGHYSENLEFDLESLMSVLFRYRVDSLSAISAVQQARDNFMEVLFEELTERPEKVMRMVSSFLSIPFSDSLLTPSELGKPFVSNTYGDRKITSGKVSTKNINKWRDRISISEASVVEFFLAHEMETYGYERGFDQIQSDASDFYPLANTLYFFRKLGFHEEVIAKYKNSRASADNK